MTAGGKTAAPSPRQRLFIEAARAEFVRNGYGASSIRTIAQEAGMSLSALYYHYKNKQDLLFGILLDCIDTHDALCAAELAGASPDPASRLRALVTGMVRFRTACQEQSLMIATEVRNLEPENASAYESRRRAANDQLREIIEAGIRDGSFTTPQPQDCRRAILAMVTAISNWYAPAGPDTPDEIAARYSELALLLLQPNLHTRE
ncbi:TetR/AcrR family transcriptional regulator [Tomitella biformata]|uniref:TetR/AcrR family transcriptional regulator n=1 Tax=Tomitella biformata TaxID=630403 RepID=UPI000466D0E0|nr:TetR/AcrR family transcriptional regulator [Tomitella biformata]